MIRGLFADETLLNPDVSKDRTFRATMSTNPIIRQFAKLVPIVLTVFILGMVIQEFSQFRVGYSIQKLTVENRIESTISLKTTTEVPVHVKKYKLLPIHYERRRILKDVCDNTIHGYIGNSTETSVHSNLIVDQKHRIVYCIIQKIGSTFLTSLLRKVSSKDNGMLERQDDVKMTSLHKLEDYEFSELHALLKNSFKLMFVRDPYERLVSGYVDKFYAANTLYWGFAKKHILPLVRDKLEKSQCGSDLTFSEFIKYIIRSETLGKHRDRHFTPIYDHCRPCQIEYDFIGKMETFKQDTTLLLKTWNSHFNSNIVYDNFESDTALNRVLSKINQVFSMRKGIVPCITMHAALSRTWRNLQIRGLVSKNIALPLQIDEMNNMTTKEMQRRATLAFENQKEDVSLLKLQKREAFVEAYSMISSEDLVKLSKILQRDCRLFDYDCAPDAVFVQSRSLRTSNRTFEYFDVLH